ncbi:MAG: hypothetical protein PHV30_11115 [Candidatus Margulisbacteria bacterium]|nr:hypothetical protein [Candidatus Margulisiibacteriota bacterium]
MLNVLKKQVIASNPDINIVYPSSGVLLSEIDALINTKNKLKEEVQKLLIHKDKVYDDIKHLAGLKRAEIKRKKDLLKNIDLLQTKYYDLLKSLSAPEEIKNRSFMSVLENLGQSLTKTKTKEPEVITSPEDKTLENEKIELLKEIEELKKENQYLLQKKQHTSQIMEQEIAVKKEKLQSELNKIKENTQIYCNFLKKQAQNDMAAKKTEIEKELAFMQKQKEYLSKNIMELTKKYMDIKRTQPVEVKPKISTPSFGTTKAAIISDIDKAWNQAKLDLKTAYKTTPEILKSPYRSLP